MAVATPVRHARPRIPCIEIPVPELAACAGYRTTRRCLRRLREARVVIRQRGAGTRRHHYFVTYAELAAGEGSWIVDAIERWLILYSRRAPAAPPPEEDDDDEG